MNSVTPRAGKEKETGEAEARRGEAVRRLVEGLGVPPLFARTLVSRGIETAGEAEELLYPRLDRLSDPWLLPDAEKGVERVLAAVDGKEQICLYGDYDADGISSTALMVRFFRHLGLEPFTYIPRRREGYGLNVDAVRTLAKRGVTLIVCLDCGSTNVAEIARAAELGVDTVVIDHHECGEIMPAAHAVVNPKRRDSKFPTRELAACGVTFFFLLALRRVLFNRGVTPAPMNLKRELDLVALGTMADMVPLVGDNRILVRFGMEEMQKRPRMWVKTFLRQNLLRGNPIDEYALNFVIIPRINASGRLSEPERSLAFLMAQGREESERLLAGLNEANRERQRVEDEILKESIREIEGEPLEERKSIVLFRSDWHIGVLGIVAQRLVEKYGKPAIVFTEVDGVCKGSGRGGNGVNLHETVKSLAHLLARFGGHKYACGISLEKRNFELFRDAFERSLQGRTEEKEKPVFYDACAAPEELTGELVELIDHLSPFGMGNPRPAFLLQAVKLFQKAKRVRIEYRDGVFWDGYVSPRSPLDPQVQGIPLSIIASPLLREDMGEKFVHLHIKECLP